ncbi:hypothetical protein NQ314_004310 [Rhamnusium bicolor]|uniref:Uncharacterized protein n=1 Tax=Rhamnusium bicolor TaxID=1586634 RepID=A0AAV8ZLF9_9CUCU|nr:hypothetical protein NQ314_004310 [Rhamnusium bicolor]
MKFSDFLRLKLTSFTSIIEFQINEATGFLYFLVHEYVYLMTFKTLYSKLFS